MAECGRRPLSSAALARLGEFLIRVKSSSLAPTTEEERVMTEQESADQERWLVEIERLESVRARLHARLEGIKGQHASAAAALALIDRDRRMFEGVSTHLEHLDGMATRTRRDWLRTHPRRLAEMQLRLDELDARITLRKRLLKPPAPEE